MRIDDTEIPDVKSIFLKPQSDARGLFVETFDTAAFDANGVASGFVQDALSVNLMKGTFRGLHFQSPPHAQDTLVRVARGRVYDVALDLRSSSATFGKHVGIELSASQWKWLFIPTGFAHGFCTLEDNTEVAYKLSGPYAPGHTGGVLMTDPDLDINWPLDPSLGVMSEKDKGLPGISNLPLIFE